MWQREVPIPDTIPAALALQLHKAGGTNWADKFRRNDILDTYRPKIATGLAREYLHIAGDGASYLRPDPLSAAGTRVANKFADALAHLKSQHVQLQKAHLSRAFDEGEIREYADNYSRMCSRLDKRGPDGARDDAASFEARAGFAKFLGIDPPEGRDLTAAGACARMDDAQWWRRRLRTAWTRRAENVMRAIGIVRKGREPYASDDAVRHRTGQKRRGRQFLENHEAVNGAGEQLNLVDVVDASVSNPAIRRAEFMTRVRGFEEIADDAGHVGQFWTLTAPSEFHAQLAKAGRNPTFKGAKVREAQEWLCKRWARARAKLKRLSILVYGFRIAEPHHDGTPHWHMLLFCRARDADTITRVIRDYWLAEREGYADELGPRDPQTGRRPRENARVKCIPIVKGAGSAAGYVAKYVAKNIDGEGAIGPAEDWETGHAINDGIRRVDAWASLHGIRQFQQIGGPPVGLYREFRRCTEVSEDERLEPMRAAADAGDWRAFVYAVNWQGIKAGRRDLNAKLARRDTGERNKYAEAKPAPIIGVQSGAHIEITRRLDWTIRKKGSGSTTGNPPSSEVDGADAAPGADAPRPTRSCANTPAMHERNWHPSGGLCGLGMGEAARKYAERKLMELLGSKRKGRTRRHRATHRERVPTAPPMGRASGSFSSFLSALGPVAITVRVEGSDSTGPPPGPPTKGGP